MPLPVPEATRARNAATTREAILRAARTRFLSDSYETVGLRDIAGDAGVDVALVGRYFGGKEELFKQVLRGSEPGKFDDLPKGTALPEFLANLATRHSAADDREHVERLILILRSASSPTAAGIVRDAFSDDVLGPIAGLLEGPEADLRASLSLAVLMGTTILETIMGVGPLCDCDREPVRRRLIRIIEAALAEQ
jgi:AcrR family transcriptional regulator